LRGQALQFFRGPKTRSPEWVFLHTPGGELRKIPKAWTSLVPAIDPYDLFPSPPLLRLEALKKLANLVASRKSRRRTK